MHDTLGQNEFMRFGGSPYKGLHGAICVFDLSNKESYDDLQKYMDMLERNVTDNMPKIIVGAKCDLTR